jgi:hypothetical protein
MASCASITPLGRGAPSGGAAAARRAQPPPPAAAARAARLAAPPAARPRSRGAQQSADTASPPEPSAAAPPPLPPVPADFWSDSRWDVVGSAAGIAIPLFAVLAVGIGFFAARTYADGATVYLVPATSAEESAKLFPAADTPLLPPQE